MCVCGGGGGGGGGGVGGRGGEVGGRGEGRFRTPLENHEFYRFPEELEIAPPPLSWKVLKYTIGPHL